MTDTSLPVPAAARAEDLVAALSPHAASELVVAPDDPGPGAWAGGPSALVHDGWVWLAYRLRRPIGHGRGFANVVARSRDGVHLETVAVLSRDAFGGESLERPALVRTPEGRWRVYVSVATPLSYHWRVDLVEADAPEDLGSAPGRTVLPGSERVAVKDAVVVRYDGRWHLWASCHPLDDPTQTDRMTTEHASSDDGVTWSWHGTAQRGRPGSWDQRGVRPGAVLLDRPDPLVLYDGRASAEENWEERTGLARVVDLDTFAPVGDAPVAASAHPAGGLRYVSAVVLGDGTTRLYYEVSRADGAHELRTVLVDHAPSPDRLQE